MKQHHITRQNRVWQVRWDGKVIAESPHGILDAWEKACDWHGQAAAEAWKELRGLENEPLLPARK